MRIVKNFGINKKFGVKIILTTFIILFSFTVASATNLDFYGNIEGIANVIGPIFYAAPGNILLINEKPDTYATYTIKNIGHEPFWTSEELGGIDFNYRLKANLYIRAKISEGEPPKRLELIFGYFDSNGDAYDICSSTINITSTNLDNYETSCVAPTNFSDVNEFYYDIRGRGDPSIEYKISTKNTKIEVDKA